MVANLDIQLTLRPEAIVVPEAALMFNGDMTFVYTVGASNVVQMRPVVVGERLAQWTEIRDGLQEGDPVIVEGHQKVGPGMPVVLAPPEKAAPYLQPGSQTNLTGQPG
jgi:multidrug efflux pump subunit AcrA (membrane-fusion protein)